MDAIFHVVMGESFATLMKECDDERKAIESSSDFMKAKGIGLGMKMTIPQNWHVPFMAESKEQPLLDLHEKIGEVFEDVKTIYRRKYDEAMSNDQCRLYTVNLVAAAIQGQKCRGTKVYSIEVKRCASILEDEECRHTPSKRGRLA